MQVISCGIIPLKKEIGQWKVLIIQHKAGHWGFPKGHVESNEQQKEAAERELREETGLIVQKYLSVRSFSFTYHCISHGKEVNKTVILFAATVTGEINLLPSEIENYTWISVEKVREKIPFMQMHQAMHELEILLKKTIE